MTSSITPQRIAGTFRAQRPLCTHRVDQLISLGVRPEVLRPDTNLRVGHVIWLPQQRFTFEHHLPASHADVGGEPAVLILVADSGGEVIDIVAWAPATGCLASWLGRAWAVGEVACAGPAPHASAQEPLPVWADPIGWLNAGQRGLVLIRPHTAAAHLRTSKPLLAQSVAHGRTLRSLLPGCKPRILLQTPAAAFATTRRTL
ncbi:hypothetical protein ACRAWG_16025 [Methylobacterium sp. P31]